MILINETIISYARQRAIKTDRTLSKYLEDVIANDIKTNDTILLASDLEDTENKEALKNKFQEIANDEAIGIIIAGRIAKSNFFSERRVIEAFIDASENGEYPEYVDRWSKHYRIQSFVVIEKLFKKYMASAKLHGENVNRHINTIIKEWFLFKLREGGK